MFHVFTPTVAWRGYDSISSNAHYELHMHDDRVKTNILSINICNNYVLS